MRLIVEDIVHEALDNACLANVLVAEEDNFMLHTRGVREVGCHATAFIRVHSSSKCLRKEGEEVSGRAGGRTTKKGKEDACFLVSFLACWRYRNRLKLIIRFSNTFPFIPTTHAHTYAHRCMYSFHSDIFLVAAYQPPSKPAKERIKHIY